MTRTKIATEELAEMWNDDSTGEYIQVNDNGTAFHIAHGRIMETISPKYGNIWAGIRAWQVASNVYLNSWSVNDHGNVTLHDCEGKSLGGLV